MSTIYKNGEWWYYQTYLDNSDGNRARVQKSLATKDKKEAQRKKREQDDKYLTQRIHLVSRTIFQDKVDDFLAYRRLRCDQGEITKNTLRSDIGSLKIFSSFFHENKYKYINEFEDRDRSKQILDQFVVVRRNAKISPNTIRRDLRHLSGFFTFCIAAPRRLLSFNPVSEVTVPSASHNRKFPDQKDWLTLRTFLRGKCKKRGTVKQALPSIAESVLWLQIETGARIGEILRLKWNAESEDRVGSGEPWSVVDDQFRLIRMYSKKRERTIPLKNVVGVAAFLKSLKKNSSSNYVFPSPVTGRPLNPSQFSRSFKKLLQSLKITRLFGTHGNRHGFISFLLNQGISADQIGWLVGHSSSQITAIYGHADHDTQSKIFKVLK